ncbi:MAG: hypothetical protein JRJ77_09325 [Deltaproteobacteria bacterium]|nr:hypothetical protein [Deltaproteobacteria bacterium]MBW2340997.1 hypothetical protein [Deltaproteobacteria bacterium]
MNENAAKDELRTEIEHGHFSKAAFLAASLDLPEKELQDLRVKALRQRLAVCRNAPGSKSLARQYGLCKQKGRDLLERHAENKRNAGDTEPLEPCYDLNTDNHLSFEEWVHHFLKRWDRLPVS